MQIKVGQWVRTDYLFEQMTASDSWEHIFGYELDDDNSITLSNEEVEQYNVTVADTPQELVQVGDLVEFEDGDRMFVDRFDGLVITHSFNKMAFVRVINRVTAIYTKDSEGNYIKQWEVS